MQTQAAKAHCQAAATTVIAATYCVLKENWKLHNYVVLSHDDS